MTQRILVVDDNLENRYLLRALLEGNGFEVDEASNGTEALSASHSRPPNAVVTDLLMPEMDGFALCREWTRDEALRHIPVIVYTATYTETKDRQFAMELGAAAFVVKPTEPDDLLQIVTSAIEKSSSMPPSDSDMEETDFFERHSRRLREKLDRKLEQLAARDKSLKEYVTLCESMLNTTSNAVVSVDPNGLVKAWNLRSEALFGYTEEEIINRPLDMLIPPNKRDDARHQLQEAFNTKKVVRFETQRIHKSGNLVDVEIALSHLGPTVGFMAVVSDLTAIRREASEKKRLEEQLAAAHRLESLGLLAGGVAHDFNNLLTVILFHAESIEEEHRNDDSQDLKSARLIRESGERAASLTRQLLAFGRKQVMKLAVMELNEVVRAMAAILKRLIGENIELQMNLAPDLGRVEMDRSQVEQIILNLAVNARDAMPDGGKLVIRTGNHTIDEEEDRAYSSIAPGRFVMLSVSDNGVGMDKETCARIFDPFFTTKAPGKGTGLGLSTVYGIVHQSGGHIFTYSEPGYGTTFKIYLPKVDLDLTSRPPAFTPVNVQAGGETILLVEDEEMVRSVARRILERAGYQVLEACDGSRALDIAQKTEGAIHLMLTDIIMPGMNGIVLAEHMMKLRPTMKVIFTSGYTDETIARHDISESGVTVLEKPFSDRSMASLVRSVLDKT
jgi:PAS domain S-box-containing protein